MASENTTPKHYTPTPGPNQTWQFTTPTGRLEGFLSRADALRISANTERDDRYEAQTGSGSVAAALRKHFGIEKIKKGGTEA